MNLEAAQNIQDSCVQFFLHVSRVPFLPQAQCTVRPGCMSMLTTSRRKGDQRELTVFLQGESMQCSLILKQ